MNLNDLNTSKYLYDPKSDSFLEELEKIPEFQFNIEGTDKKSLCTYIALMCDPESDIRKTYTYYPTRKKEAGLCSGFKLGTNGKFKEEIEELIIGTNPDFNKALVKYLSLTYDAGFVRYNIFQQLQFIAFQNALNGDSNAIKIADQLTEKLREEEVFIFGGKEVGEMRKALYQEAAKRELNIKPEDIAYGLAEGKTYDEFSPLGKEYKVKQMHFISDELPKE